MVSRIPCASEATMTLLYHKTSPFSKIICSCIICRTAHCSGAQQLLLLSRCFLCIIGLVVRVSQACIDVLDLENVVKASYFAVYYMLCKMYYTVMTATFV